MRVQLQAVGRVEGDPKLVVTPVGTPFTTFPLAITTKRCLEDLTIQLTCWAWGEQAQTNAYRFPAKVMPHEPPPPHLETDGSS